MFNLNPVVVIEGSYSPLGGSAFRLAAAIRGLKLFEVDCPHFKFARYGAFNNKPSGVMFAAKSEATLREYCAANSLWYGFTIKAVL